MYNVILKNQLTRIIWAQNTPLCVAEIGRNWVKETNGKKTHFFHAHLYPIAPRSFRLIVWELAVNNFFKKDLKEIW